MRRFRRLTAVLAVLFILFTAPVPVFAKWTGGVIMSKEYTIGYAPMTIYTVVLDYEISKWWYVDVVIDTCPPKGMAADVSTTFYLSDWFSKVTYVTIGCRTGSWYSERGSVLYWSMACRF